MRLKSTKYLVWILLATVIAGIIEGCLPNDPSGHGFLFLPQGIVMAVLTFLWCRSHAYENNITLSHSYPAFAGLFPPLGIPMYFFRFFGFRKGGMKVLKSIGFLLLLGIGYSFPYGILKELR